MVIMTLSILYRNLLQDFQTQTIIFTTIAWDICDLLTTNPAAKPAHLKVFL